MQQIEYGRTVSKGYQSGKFVVVINFPDSVKLSQAYELAMFMVRAHFTQQWTGFDITRHQEVYEQCFHESIHEFLNRVRPPATEIVPSGQ